MSSHGNIGDSCSAMGRIAYFDAKARVQTADAASFDTQLNRMQKDLLFCAPATIQPSGSALLDRIHRISLCCHPSI